MLKPSKTRRGASTKSGVMRSPLVETEGRREPVYPPSLPELKDDAATTGAIQAVNEGRDITAIGDDDRVNGN
jgi:hypothetical protein